MVERDGVGTGAEVGFRPRRMPGSGDRARTATGCRGGLPACNDPGSRACRGCWARVGAAPPLVRASRLPGTWLDRLPPRFRRCWAAGWTSTAVRHQRGRRGFEQTAVAAEHRWCSVRAEVAARREAGLRACVQRHQMDQVGRVDEIDQHPFVDRARWIDRVGLSPASRRRWLDLAREARTWISSRVIGCGLPQGHTTRRKACERFQRANAGSETPRSNPGTSG